MLEVIDEKKNQLDYLHPLLKYTLKSLREKLFLEWTDIKISFKFEINDSLDLYLSIVK